MADKEKEQLSFNLESGQSSADEDPNKRIADGKSLEWVCHPAKKNMTVSVLVSALIVVLVSLVYFITFSIWFCVLAFLILFGSLSSFYFPSRYILTENEIMIKTRMQTVVKKWSQYRTFYPDKNGVFLSPFVRPTRLENFRGLYIKFWYNKDEVVAFVKEQVEKHHSGGGGA
jgi:hypothetical protein